MKKNLILLIVFCAAFCSFAEPVRLTSGEKTDVASGPSRVPKYWSLGGIKGTWLAVGQPNRTNRQDKVIFRFDIRRFLAAGQVKRAILSYRQGMHPGSRRDEKIQLEHFTVERATMSEKDLNTRDIEKIHEYTVPLKNKSQITSVDVTAYVNNDLKQGFGFAAFRLSSLTDEDNQLPEGPNNCVDIEKKSITLEVEPLK